MITFQLDITGTMPLLMHNSRLANPLDPIVKEIGKLTKKRTKTDEDREEVARLEHAGSLYIDSDIGPYLPGQNVERALLDAARISKQGKTIERGVFITTEVNPLAYKGPRTADGLWADENFRHHASVKIMRARTMRCRPIFREWRTSAEGVLDPAIIDFDTLQQICRTAGMLIGIGDWRPRFGRFEAAVRELATV